MNRINQYSFTEKELTIDWRDGRRSVLAALWLRDHCQMPQSRDPVSGQRLHDITDISLEVGIMNVTQSQDSLIMDFSEDSHRSEFSIDWLLQNCYCVNQQIDNRSESSKILWRGGK